MKKTVAVVGSFILGALALSAAAAGTPSSTPMSAAKTVRVSVSSKGAQGNLPSWVEGISADARYVVFSSGSADLVPRDTNGRQDAFLRDRKTGRTTRVSVSSSGQQGKAAHDPFGGSAAEAISANGRYILFRSDAANLVSGDTNGAQDIFIRDRTTRRTTRVSVGSGGRQANGSSDFAVFSPNGRYVAFSSSASNLVPGDTNRAPDVFVRDRVKGTTQRVSLGTRARQANRESEQSAISANGRYVAFESGASNLVPGDTNAMTDVFVRDRKTGRTTRVSVNSRGKQGTGDRTHNGSNGPSISANGRYVAFHSAASNLVSGDTNRTFDIFVHDRRTGNTQRVSISNSGGQANGENIGAPRISPDGRYVAYASLASNLVPGDDNDITDAFLRDRRTDRTMLVSLSSRGAQGSDASWPNGVPAFSAGNRYLAFSSWAGNLVAGDTNGTADAFVRDLRGTLGAARALLAASANGQPASQGRSPSLSFAPSTNGAYDYGAVTVGQTRSQTFILTNSGGSASGTLTLELSGSTAFTKTTDGCTARSIGPGNSCRVTVRYAPTAAGQVSATLAARGEQPGVGATLALRGTGALPGHVYWANTGTNTIGRADLDGNPANVSQSFISGASFPFGVAVEAG